jgi:hypothetical protein
MNRLLIAITLILSIGANVAVYAQINQTSQSCDPVPFPGCSRRE